jgi:hypothetical protein
MTEPQIVALAISIILGLIGVLYRIHSGDIKENKEAIKKLDDETDTRLDNVEKDIIQIKTRQDG